MFSSPVVHLNVHTAAEEAEVKCVSLKEILTDANTAMKLLQSRVMCNFFS